MFDRFKRRVKTIPDGAVTRNLRGDNWHIGLDLTPQVLSLSIPTETTWHREEELVATCGALDHFRKPGFISASMLALKAKLFDDSLYAAVELAMQPAKQKLLASLIKVTPLMAAAARLGGIEAPDSPIVERITKAFLDDELSSKPLGFYTWNEELRRIFQQDRLLQKTLEPGDAEALMTALNAEPRMRTAYQSHMEIMARLTNPFAPEKPELFKPGGACFFPPSRSHESDLVRRLYGGRPIPAGFSLVDEMVKQVREGSLKLDPTEQSGWYDFQTWALEPLLVPERMPDAHRLIMDGRYRKQLEDLFKATLAMTRETHVKQLEIPICGAAGPSGWSKERVIVEVAPQLTVEPIRAYYERRALGYEFVRHVLNSVAPLRSMRGITARGPSQRTLDEDLEEMTALFHGAAAVAGHELGIEAATRPEAARFREWARKPDVSDDVRMMVPVFYDIGRRKTKVWAILGWATRSLTVSFDTRPNAHIHRGSPQIEWVPLYESIPYPVFAETYVSRLLDHDEFRAHCDRYKTVHGILDHL